MPLSLGKKEGAPGVNQRASFLLPEFRLTEKIITIESR